MTKIITATSVISMTDTAREQPILSNRSAIGSSR